ncbi:hypothetical protein [Lacrimispora sp.]|uniref:hypothetical protein n=1 Tax=Lacrimispora sp. TaxID=2719234 RepID=UPI00345F1FC1
MNYLWETLLQAKNQGLKGSEIRYELAERYSAYIEVSGSCLNQEYLEPGAAVEINPYYRFFDIFKDLFPPDPGEFPKLRENLTNLILHQLAENDLRSGMTKEEYYKKMLYQDIQNGSFGGTVKENFKLFCREEREIILSGLLRQYETGSSLDIFLDMMQSLIKNNIVYQNNYNSLELLVFIGQKKGETLELKMDFLIRMFVDIPYHVELFYEHHFGIIGMEEAMVIGETILC